MRMRSLGVMLLAFNIMVHLAFKFSPIPFLGLAVSLAAFPLALRISWRQLFIIEAVSWMFSLFISAEQTIAQFWMGYDVLMSLGLAVYATSYVVTFCVFLPVLLILGSAASATIMKLAARHTPERFKHIW